MKLLYYSWYSTAMCNDFIKIGERVTCRSIDGFKGIFCNDAHCWVLQVPPNVDEPDVDRARPAGRSEARLFLVYDRTFASPFSVENLAPCAWAKPRRRQPREAARASESREPPLLPCVKPYLRPHVCITFLRIGRAGPARPHER